jgi:hypothetical protein
LLLLKHVRQKGDGVQASVENVLPEFLIPSGDETQHRDREQEQGEDREEDVVGERRRMGRSIVL